MKKTVLAAGTIVALFAITTVLPAQAHWRGEGTSHKHKSNVGHFVKHRHVRNLHKRHYKKYRAHHRHHVWFENSFRPDCKMYGKRARLTGNTYWAYAAYHCRTAIFKGEYK